MKNRHTDVESAMPKPHRAWMAVAAVAVLIRAIYFFQYVMSECNGYLHADNVYYRSWASHILNGGWTAEQVFQQGPLYAYLLAAAFAVGIDDNTILVFQLLAGVATSILVYFCGRRLFDEKTAILAGCMTATYGPLVFYECMLMKSFLAPLFTMLALYFGLRYSESNRWRWLVAASAAIGFACLLREVYVLLMLPIAILAMRNRRDSTSIKFLRLKQLTLAATAFLAPIAPATIRNYVVANEFAFVTVGGGEVMYIAHGPYADGYWNSGPIKRPNAFREHEAFHQEAEKRLGRELTRTEASRYWYGETWQSIVDQPLRFVNLTFAKSIILLNNYEFPDSANIQIWPRFVPILSVLPSFGFLVGIGVLGLCLATRNWKRVELAIGLMAMHIAGVLLVYNFGRFRIGMMPLWILFAAYGLTSLPRLFRNGSGWSRVGVGVLSIIALAVTLRAFALPPGISPQKLQSQNDGYREIVVKQAHVRTRLRKLRAALPKSSDLAGLHSQIASNLLKINRVDDALEHHQMALKLDSSNAEIRARFGADLIAAGFTNEGIVQLETAIEMRPRLANAHDHVARAYHQQGNVPLAAYHYRIAVRLDPSRVIAANNLALILITHPRHEFGNSKQAIALAESVYQRVGSDPSVMDTLAAAYAADGRFDDAIRIVELAIQAAKNSGNDRLARSIAKSRDLYRRRQTRWP